MKDYYIGLDLGGTNIKSAIFADGFTKVCQVKIPTEAQYGSHHVLKRMNHAINLMLKDAALTASDIRCMGIGIPGSLDLVNGIAKYSPNFSNWKDVPVVRQMQDTFQIHTFIDNDARMNLYGEWQQGAGKGKQNVVLLTLGTGIGAGVVVDGHVLYGASAGAGEIGHMKLIPGGRRCNCGGAGCFEAYASATGLVRTAEEKLSRKNDSILSQWIEEADQITADMVSQAYDLGDSLAKEIFQVTGQMLGYGLANVINLFNPELLIIGGGMAAAGERLLKYAREIVATNTLPDAQNVCSIITATLGNVAGILGAAIYAKQAFEERNFSS